MRDLQDDVAATSADRSAMAELRASVQRMERRLAAIEPRIEALPGLGYRIDDVDEEVVELARRVHQLRAEFDMLVEAFAG